MNLLNHNIYDDFTPLPQDLQGWNSQHPVFEQLILELRPEIIIEVGTWKGASAIHMASICKARGLKTKIYCVDTWLGALEFWTSLKDTPERDLMLKNGYPQIYYQFLSNVVHNGLQEYIIPVPMPSQTAAQVLKHYKVGADMIYIDASHEYEDVKSDIIDYMYLLNDGGVMFGDDYGWPSVKRAVDECFHVNQITQFPIDVVDGNYWLHKIN